MSSEGNSERNLDSGFIFVCPQVILLWAWEMNSTSFALVIATYISLLSSSKSFGSSIAFASGKTESSAPTIKTTGNSSPLLEWTVMSFTASVFSSLFSMVSTIKVTSSKNHLKSSYPELTTSWFALLAQNSYLLAILISWPTFSYFSSAAWSFPSSLIR